MLNTEQIKKDETLKSEVNIFWSKIAEYLPKSLERSALGDEKIYKAFYQAYTEFRPVFLSQQLSKQREEIEKLKCEVPSNERIGNPLSENNVNKSLIYAGRFNYNKAIEDVLSILDTAKSESEGKEK